ncbi:MAG: hypothetical protein FWD47_06555 [Treponema sp.]|nr:hypothetical protein [Treponema sp.]
MKKFIQWLLVVVATGFWGCVSIESASELAPTSVTSVHVSDMMYYGADLSQFPKKFREWIVYRAFPQDQMEQPSMIDPKLKIWWGEDRHSIYSEVTYTIAQGYVGAGNTKTWRQNTYSGSPVIFDWYGEYSKYHTLKFNWEYENEVERLLKTDPAYAEIVEFAKKLNSEIEYDYANYSGYSGAPVIRTPGMRYLVCGGYADEVMDKALELKSVQAVKKWSSSSHAWNELILTDGRILFFDLTWYSNKRIDHETGVIYEDSFNWKNVTFNEELFKYSGIGFGTRRFEHAFGFLVSERWKD